MFVRCIIKIYNMARVRTGCSHIIFTTIYSLLYIYVILYNMYIILLYTYMIIIIPSSFDGIIIMLYKCVYIIMFENKHCCNTKRIRYTYTYYICTILYYFIGARAYILYSIVIIYVCE